MVRAQGRNGSLFIRTRMNWRKKIVVLCHFGTVLLVVTVSQFGGRDKKTAWEVWRAYPHVTETFIKFSGLCDVKPTDKNTWNGMFVCCTTERHHTIPSTSVEEVSLLSKDA